LQVNRGSGADDRVESDLCDERYRPVQFAAMLSEPEADPEIDAETEDEPIE